MKEQKLVSQIEQELAQIQELIAQVEMLLELIRLAENQNLRSGLVKGLALHLHSFYTGAERIFYDIAQLSLEQALQKHGPEGTGCWEGEPCHKRRTYYRHHDCYNRLPDNLHQY